jgi:outer membrane protein assembly factor BamE (lipoprotein component of BamABCDE complex)
MNIKNRTGKLFRAMLAAPSLVFVGCMQTAAQHASQLHSEADRQLTVGTVQAKIVRGMSSTEVAEVLGSPNIVTSDQGGDESWVYDKIATEASYSNDEGGGVGLLGAGRNPGVSLLLGGLIGTYSRSAGASATQQRTLTVVIKFDSRNRVKDFSYHTSRF